MTDLPPSASTDPSSEPTPASDPTSGWTPTDSTQAIHGQDTVPVPVPNDRPVSHDVPVPPAPTSTPPSHAAPAGPVGTDLSALPPPVMPPYAVGPGGQAGPGRTTGTNGLAIAALCCGLAAVVPLVGVVAIVLGVVALHQLRQVPGSGQRGRGMAIAGIVLGALGTLAWAALLTVGIISAVTSEPERDSAGQVTNSSEVFVNDLAAGDCFSGGRTDEIDLVTAVPCAQPHESQVVTIFELPKGAYPGEHEVVDAAEEGCTAKADPLVTDSAYEDLEPSFIYPDSYTWRGDRTVLCLVEAPTGTTTGSALK